MNILIYIRDALAAISAAMLAALWLTACSESPLPQSPTAPTVASGTGAASASRLVPQDRTVPVASRWVGDEHNRLVALAVTEVERVRRTNPSELAALRHDCAWLVNFVKSEARSTLTRAGFSGDVEATFALAEPSMMRIPQCAAGTSRSSRSSRTFNLFATTAFAPVTPVRTGGEEFSPAAFAAIDAALKGIARSRNRVELDAVIGNAAASARLLSPSDAAAVHAVLSVAQGSAKYWSAVRPKSARLSLFALSEGSDWDEFVAVLGADAGGCSATLGFFRMFQAALPMNAKIGLCGLGAAVASVAYFVD
jgi:hypothetical protein